MNRRQVLIGTLGAMTPAMAGAQAQEAAARKHDDDLYWRAQSLIGKLEQGRQDSALTPIGEEMLDLLLEIKR